MSVIGHLRAVGGLARGSSDLGEETLRDDAQGAYTACSSSTTVESLTDAAGVLEVVTRANRLCLLYISLSSPGMIWVVLKFLPGSGLAPRLVHP